MNVRQTFYYFAIMKEIIKLIDLLKLKNNSDIYSIRKNILRIPKKIQAIGQKCYFFVSIKVFNALPSNLKEMIMNSCSIKKWLVNLDYSYCKRKKKK